jgi:transcriptional regulator with XRE-family HTH domain
MARDQEHRDELGRFLRSRRERVNPEQLGFPVSTRRRTQGLRREEVAVLAGVSPTWYTYLEQGRNIHPSTEVLDSIARVLRLTEEERRYMHTLAYGQVLKPQPLSPEAPAELLARQLVDSLERFTYPVYATNTRCDLLAWNGAAADWYDDWGRLPPGERNMMHWMLVSPQARQRLLDWKDDTRDIVARWRAEVARWPADVGLRQLVAEFALLSPDFRRWWNDHDVEEHRSRIRRFRHPKLGERPMRILITQSVDFAPCIVVIHLPAADGDAADESPGRP